MKRKTHTVDMTQGGVFRHIIKFSIPLMLTGILQCFYNAADMIVVGRFSSQKDLALAAVGSTGPAINLVINLFIGMAMAAGIMVSRKFGAKNESGVSKAVHSSMTVSIIGGAFLSVIGVFLAKPILKMMNVPKEVIDLSVLYVRIYFSGALAMLVYNFGAAILRAVGDTKRPLYYLTFSGIVNVVLNLFFVIVCKMSVDGVAIATLISQVISAVLVLRALIHTDECYKLCLKKLRVDIDDLKDILYLGIPAGIQGAMFSISNMIIQSSINGVGTVAMAANAAGGNIEGFLYTTMNSFNNVTLTLISQNYGAKKFARIKRGAIASGASVIVAGLILGLGVSALSEFFMSFYTADVAVINAGAIRMRYMITIYFLLGLMETSVGALRGLGLSFRNMIISIITICGGRLLAIFLYGPFHTLEDLNVLYISYPVTWALTALANYTLFIIVFRSRKKKYELSEADCG